MKLNHGKTTIIPLDRFINSDGDPFDCATRYVASLSSPLNTARVRQHVNYLGVVVGPTAAANMWKAPFDKWQRRARQLAVCGVAQDATLREYRGRALSCLIYITIRRVAAEYSAHRAEARRHDGLLPLLCVPASRMPSWTSSTPRPSSSCGRILPRCHHQGCHTPQGSTPWMPDATTTTTR